MSIETWLIHTCTIERDQTATEDDYNADVADFVASSSGVRCRMVVKMVRSPLGGGLGENPVLPSYRLFLPANADIDEGDRITTVVDETGAAIGATWTVQQVLVRRSSVVRFVTVHLEKAA